MIKNSKKILKEKKYLVISTFFDNNIRHGGVKRADQVRELFQENNFTSIQVLKDFSGIGRFTIGRYK